MKQVKFCTLLLLILVGRSLFAQQHHQVEEHNAESYKHDAHQTFKPHRIALLTGYGLISGAIDENGTPRFRVIPVFAFDYEYWFTHKIGLGLHNEIELANYTVEGDHQDQIQRNYAFVASIVFCYELVNNWGLFAGPGYEFEQHHNFALFKIGTDITKSFEDGWAIGLVVAYDFKEVNSAMSMGLSVSKRLGKQPKLSEPH